MLSIAQLKVFQILPPPLRVRVRGRHRAIKDAAGKQHQR
jgi:hypothetical protein